MSLWQTLKAAAESGRRLGDVESSIRDLRRAIGGLEDDVAGLLLSQQKLRGRLTGALRTAQAEEQQPTDLNEQIRKGLLTVRGANGVLRHTR